METNVVGQEREREKRGWCGVLWPVLEETIKNRGGGLS
ncbi:hypothetical protein NC653_010339 [Populus alba x Populus x berolinensis]|uniref:Uncharacterized protein n=1 Tax=Populus alba x Populus x berolinensis TaxID=444605 RepID=A0AAD6W542_9ROSI|nr:hypothetical protein NC653_010339 [Populus alba x Populus x berolinensis]